MKKFGWKLALYIISAVVPYFVFSWILLSVILFIQQASRFSDIFFSNNLPSALIWQLTGALIPSVIAFTCPMAVLVGVIVGLSKMQGDRELVAIRAAGIGNFQIIIPIALLGALLTAFAFFINVKGVPYAAAVVRQVAIRAAITKLESPIEPGVFNTEIQGYTLYVRDGDWQTGTWKNIFIFNEDKNNSTRLITSRAGRIDSDDEKSELILENALVTTFSDEKSISESVRNLRLTIKTRRGELIEKMSRTDDAAEELGLVELWEFAGTKTGKERTEALILWQRKIILSFTPLLFALLGASLVLRFNRRGQGMGIFLALAGLLAYYTVTLAGEQLTRTGAVNVFLAGILPIALTVVLIIRFFRAEKSSFRARNRGFKNFKIRNPFKKFVDSRGRLFRSFSTGILDLDIIGSLLKYYLLTLGFLGSIYLIFTALELWKRAGTMENGVNLLAQYLLYLTPLIYIQISASCLMIATLATYVIKSLQNEVVTWAAAGQSIYRLLFPCFLLMAGVGFLNWQIQERVLPETNQIQDSLRARLRNKGVFASKEGKYWVATDRRIFSFEMPDSRTTETSAQKVGKLSVYEFTEDQTSLKSVSKVDSASWEQNKIKFISDGERIRWQSAYEPQKERLPAGESIAEEYNPFQVVSKPSYMNAAQVAAFIENSESESERRIFSVALEKKYATPFLPLIVVLLTAPLALTLNQRGKVANVGYAVGIWLTFLIVSNAFEQFGASGSLPPKVAVWSPLVFFALLGGYLLTKART